MGDFVFVTAASENHTLASLRCIDMVQKYFKSRKIIFYDIGISSKKWIKQVNFYDICNNVFIVVVYCLCLCFFKLMLW